MLQYDTAAVQSSHLNLLGVDTVSNARHIDLYSEPQLSSHLKANSACSERTKPSSHARYSCLSKAELTSRLKQTKSLQKDTSRKVKQLEAKLEAAQAAIERASHAVDEGTHSDLVTIVEQQSSVVAKQFPPDSFAHICW